MDTLLDIQNLEISFQKERGYRRVVNGISFQIPKGSVIGIVGESGSGKSVTALSLMRLLPQLPYCKVHGAVSFMEGRKKTIFSNLPEERMRIYRGRKISMIFQEPMTSLNPVFTCGDQIMEVLRLHLHITVKEAKNKALHFFKQVELKEPIRIFDSYPHQLSGGQKQRVMIALAISCSPDLIIADEPTTALDVTVQRAILKILRRLQQQLHVSILFITHDLGVIREVADEVLVMYQGNIVEKGRVKDIFNHPTHAYTKGLLASRPPINRTLKRLPTMADFVSVQEDGQVLSKQTGMDVLLHDLEKEEKEIPLTGSSVLRVKDLTVRYTGKKNFLGKVAQWTEAVQQVSFEVKQGEILGLAGESGCGKSTLSRAIMQLIHVQKGEVWLKDVNLCTLSPKEIRKFRSKIQLIFQDPYSALNPRLTVGQAVLEPMKLHKKGHNDKERKEKIEDLFNKVGLPLGIFNDYPHEFSGGQRQRICIARTLALEPAFIICDEAVSALDVSVQAQVLNLFRKLKDEFGFSCIFISHDLSVLKFMSHRIMIMNKGRLVEINTPSQIFNAPASPYTRKLIHAIPG